MLYNTKWHKTNLQMKSNVKHNNKDNFICVTPEFREIIFSSQQAIICWQISVGFNSNCLDADDNKVIKKTLEKYWESEYNLKNRIATWKVTNNPVIWFTA